MQHSSLPISARLFCGLLLLMAIVWQEAHSQTASWQPVGPSDVKQLSVRQQLKTIVRHNASGQTYAASSGDGYVVIRRLNATTGAWVLQGAELETTGDFYFSLDNNGIPVVSYTPTVSGSAQDPAVVRLNGSTWETLGSSGPGSSVGPLAFDNDNTPVTLVNEPITEGEVTTTKPSVKRWNGTEWIPVGNAGFAEQQILNPDIFFTPSEELIVSFYIDTGDKIRAYKLDTDTQEWEQLSNNGLDRVDDGFASFNSMVLDNSGVPWIGFRDASGLENGKLTVRKFESTGWETVGSLGISDGGVQYVKIGKSADGTIYVAYKDLSFANAAEQGITVKKWTGTAWEMVGTKGFTSTSAYPYNWSFDGNTPYLSYRDESLESQTSVVVRWNGTEWERVNGETSLSGGEATSVSLAIGTSGEKYVAFRDFQNFGRLSVKRWDGSAWVDVGDAGFSSGAVTQVTIRSNASGAVFVAYTDENESNKAFVKQYNSGTGGWDTYGGGAASTLGVTSLQLLINPAGEPVVAYSDNFDSNRVKVRVMEGGSWATLGGTAVNDEGTADFSIAYDGEGNLWSAQRSLADGISGGRLVKFNGTTWEEGVVNIVPDITFTGFKLAFDANDRPLIAVVSGSNGSKVRLSRLENDTWTVLGNEGLSAGAATQVRLLTDAAGFPYLGYADAGNEGKYIVRRWNGSAWIGNTTLTAGAVDVVDMQMNYSGELGFVYNTNGAYVQSIKTQAILFDPLTAKLPTDASFELSATGGPSGNPVTFSSSNATVATISGTTVTIVGGGVTNITASQAGNAEYLPAISVVRQLVVKFSQQITFDALPEKTFGDEAFTLSATGGGSGNAVTFTSYNTNVATIEGTTVTPVGAGTTTITASQAGSDNYSEAVPVQRVLTVNKAAQTITFGTLETVSTQATTVELTATASSELPVSYSSGNTDVATIINGNTVLLSDVAGTTIITASQAGNDNYLPATPVERTLVVKLPQTITFDNNGGGNGISKTFGDEPFDLNLRASSDLPLTVDIDDELVATLDGSTVTLVGAGTASITVSQAGNDTYFAAIPLEISLSVSKVSQTIVFPVLSQSTYAYTTTPLEFTITGGPANQVVLTSSDESVATVSGFSVTFVGVGPVTLTATQAGNDNYEAADPVERSFEVVKANQTFSFPEETQFTYGGGPVFLSLQSSVGLPVTYTSDNEEVVEIINDKAYFRGVGTATVGASQAGNTLYNAGPSVSRQWLVQTATLTVTARAEEITYGDPVPALSYTYSGFVNGEDATALTSAPTISTTATSSSDAGEYPITLSNGAANNYGFDFVNAVLTINKAPQTITIEPVADKLISDASFDIQASTTASGVALTYAVDGPATISGSTVTLNGQPGAVTVTVSQAGNQNYLSATAQVTFQVTDPSKTNQTITFNPLNEVGYSSNTLQLSAVASSGLPVSYSSSNTAVATVSGSTVTLTGVGSTVITASQAGNGSFNPAPNVQQTLTVVKANQTITIAAIPNKLTTDGAFDVEASVNTNLPLSLSISGPATISGSTITLSGAVGTVTLTAAQAGNELYLQAEATESFEVTAPVVKQAQTITFDALAAKTFGDAAFDLTASGGASGNTVTFASSNAAVATISGNTVTIIGAGTTTITANQAGNDNYNAAAAVEQVLTVNKANQTITFTALEAKTFGDAAFDLTASGGASGNAVTFVSSNAAVATISGNTVTIIGAGTTTITANQAGNDNYNAASAVEQVLTVNKASQTITFAEIVNQVLSTGSITLGATASSGLAVSYEVTGPATLSGTTLTFTGAGDITVTASQTGNVNFMAAIALPRTFTVTDDTPVDPVKYDQAITFEAIPDKTFGDATFDLTATSSSGLPVSYTVTGSATVSGSTVTITGAGSVTITASQAGDDSFNAAADVAQSFNVNKANATITLSELEQEVDGTPKTPSATTDPAGLEVIFTFDGEVNVPAGPGSYAVVATVNDANYQGSTEATFVLEEIVETGADDDLLKVDIGVYPNPAVDYLTIEISEGNKKNDMYSARLFGLNGHELINQQFTDLTYSLNLQHRVSGIYLLVITDGEGVLLKKVKVKKE